MNFGSVLIPEGLIEFIPAVKALIAELNDLLAHDSKIADMELKEMRQYVIDHLSKDNAKTYASLPADVARQLTLDRDPHGNVQVSLIETEKLISRMVANRLEEMREEGKYDGKFATMHHFFGYEGRCADPSNFDADYCYGLGYNAACLIKAGVTGYMTLLRDLTKPSVQWIPGGVPITMLMNMERRKDETRYPESTREAQRHPVQEIRRQTRSVGRRNRLRISRADPVFRSPRSLRPTLNDSQI